MSITSNTEEAQYSPRPEHNSCEDDFFGWIADHLGDRYVKLASASLMSIRTGVFIKRKYYYKVTELKYSTVATGIANMLVYNVLHNNLIVLETKVLQQ